MSQPLFFFSQLNGLDTVPLHQIKTVEITDDQAKFNLVADEGNKYSETRKLTPFVEMQIKEFGIESFRA